MFGESFPAPITVPVKAIDSVASVVCEAVVVDGLEQRHGPYQYYILEKERIHK